jgi:prophage regulatory protein
MAIIPETGFLRLAQIIGCKTSKSKKLPLIPVCKSTWWAGVKNGRFPKPVKLGKRITVWKIEDIRNLLEKGVDNITSSKPFPKEMIGAKKKIAKKKKSLSKSRG